MVGENQIINTAFSDDTSSSQYKDNLNVVVELKLESDSSPKVVADSIINQLNLSTSGLINPRNYSYQENHSEQFSAGTLTYSFDHLTSGSEVVVTQKIICSDTHNYILTYSSSRKSYELTKDIVIEQVTDSFKIQCPF